MTKAVLVIDMPSCCNVCIFNNAIGECKFVGNVDEALAQGLRYVECPLKPMTNSLDWKLINETVIDNSEYYRCVGRQELIDEILGEEIKCG